MNSAVRRAIQALAFLLVSGVVLGCGLLPNERPTGDRIVDGWPIGGPFACDDAARCQALGTVAREGLDQYYAGHAEIVEFGLYSEGSRVDPETGKRILVKRSIDCCEVALFRLADGTEHALGVGYPGFSTTPMAIPGGP
jgi:hypothetical protein